MIISALLISVVLHVAAPPRDTLHCAAAAAFLRGDRHMIAAVDVDTINDWRTGMLVRGCRITAAGATDVTVQAEAIRFYERLRAAKWTRTPEPRDSPNEASLRFRWEASDCLFNVNAQALLNTDAEMRVNEKLLLAPTQTRYQVFVMCMPAMKAAPR